MFNYSEGYPLVAIYRWFSHYFFVIFYSKPCKDHPINIGRAGHAGLWRTAIAVLEESEPHQSSRTVLWPELSTRAPQDLHSSFQVICHASLLFQCAYIRSTVMISAPGKSLVVPMYNVQYKRPLLWLTVSWRSRISEARPWAVMLILTMIPSGLALIDQPRGHLTSSLKFIPSGKRLHNYGKIHRFSWEISLEKWWF